MAALGRKKTAEKAAAETEKVAVAEANEAAAEAKETAADVKAEEKKTEAEDKAKAEGKTSAENSSTETAAENFIAENPADKQKEERYAAENSAEAQPKTENSVAAQADAEESAAEKAAEEKARSSFGTAANLQQELKNQLACGDRQRRIAAALLDKAEKGDLSAWKLVAELVGGIRQSEDTDRVIRVQISGFEE